MKIAEKLALRLKEDLGLEVRPELRRTYAGHRQREQGAWSWVMPTLNKGYWIVGSQHAAKTCLAAKRLSKVVNGGDITICPEK